MTSHPLRRGALQAAVLLAAACATPLALAQVPHWTEEFHFENTDLLGGSTTAGNACLSYAASKGYPPDPLPVNPWYPCSHSYGLPFFGSGWLFVPRGCPYGAASVESTPACEAFLGVFRHCPKGKKWVDSAQECWNYVDVFSHRKPCDPCKENGGLPGDFGNPIFPATGAKRLDFDIGSLGGQPIGIRFDSRAMLPTGSEKTQFTYSVAIPSFGGAWSGTLHRSLVRYVDVDGALAGVQLSRGGGDWIPFVLQPDGMFVPDADIADRLQATPGGWFFYDAARRSLETYDAAGVLRSIHASDGRVLTTIYSTATTSPADAPAAGLLIGLQDHFGRLLQLRYEAPPGSADLYAAARIRQIELPDQTHTDIEYDAGSHLSRIRWPDGGSRGFAYGRPDLPWAVTSVTDELDAITSSYEYDAAGRATATQRAGGAGRYASAEIADGPTWAVTESLDPTRKLILRRHGWIAPGQLTVTDPFGRSLVLRTQLIEGLPRIVSRSWPMDGGSSQTDRTASFDAAANLVSATDFTGRKTCYAYDKIANAQQKNLENVRVEGLSDASACPPDVLAYAIPTGLPLQSPQHKYTTEWHPQWRLRAREAGPRLQTYWVYNGQSDPSNSGATLTCAPSDALLPDQSPIAVLCKKIEQPTTDATGTQGFAATSVGPARVWSYTYNRWGQKLSENGPRTDVADQSTWQYYDDTSTAAGSEHTMGDLKLHTNAAGHKTEVLRYDKAGRPLRRKEPSGAITDFTYTPRGWLSTTTVTPATAGGALLTQYDYWPTGLLKQVTQPDGSWLSYGYDDAHRLTDIADNLGNTVHYQLDAMGNRLFEDTKDPAGALARSIARTYDALSRMQTETLTYVPH